MNASDLIILTIVVVLVAAALVYIRKSKKAGKHCVGCPDSGSCSCHCGFFESEGKYTTATQESTSQKARDVLSVVQIFS